MRVPEQPETRAARRVRPVADPETRPSTVVTAYWLAIATAVASFLLNGIGLVSSVPSFEAQRDAFVRRGEPSGQAQASVVAVFVVVAVVTVAYSVLLVLAARRMRAGRPPARVVTTVLAAVSLLSIVGFGIGAITGLLAAFAIIFAWLPLSSDWFRTARRAG